MKDLKQKRGVVKMEDVEQKCRLNNNLIIPNININTINFLIGFAVLRFTLHPTYLWDAGCGIMAKVKKSKRTPRHGEVTPSHTLILDIRRTIEVDCIVLLFSKLLLPNIDYHYREIESGIQLPHLIIGICRILKLSEALMTTKDLDWAFKEKLGVDLRE